MKPPVKPAVKGGKPLPPGAHRVPGSKYEAAVKGARPGKPVQIDRNFVADPRGGPELVARHGVEVRDNRTKSPR